MVKTVAYYRVSTTEQGDKHSLPEQRELMHSHAKRMGWEIVAEFEDQFSAKTFNRKGWQLLLTYCKNHRKEIDQVAVKSLDRFSRNLLGALQSKKELEDLGIKLAAIELPISDDPYGRFMESIFMSLAETDNELRSQKVKDANAHLYRNGYHCGNAPKGFVNHRTPEGKPSLKPGEKAPAILQAFTMAAEGHTNEDIRRHLAKNGVQVAHGQMKYLLQNPVYMGMVRTGEEVYPGKHEPIVSETLFKAVQYKLAGKPIPKQFTHSVSEFYLKGLVVCKCGDLVTASKSRSRNGSRITYYHSKTQCGCKERISETALNDSITQTLGRLNMPEWVVNAYYDILRHEMEKGAKDNTAEIQKLQQQKIVIEKRAAKLQEDYFNGMAYQLFERLDNQLNAELHTVVEGIKALQVSSKSRFELVNKPALWICNLRNIYSQGTGEVRRKIVGSIFKEKIVVSGKKSSNHQFIDFIDQLCSIDAGFRGIKKIGTPELTGIPIRYPESEGFSNHPDLIKIYELGEFLKKTA